MSLVSAFRRPNSKFVRKGGNGEKRGKRKESKTAKEIN